MNYQYSMTLSPQQNQFKPVLVEGDENEVISPEEIAEIEAAWQDYLAGKESNFWY